MSSQLAAPRQRPSIRLIFDENLPWRVAAALEVLEFNSTYVGNQHHSNVPSRGSTDEEVLSYAQKANQVVVTSNHDMVLLCAERQQSVIWVDPRGRQFSYRLSNALAAKSLRFQPQGPLYTVRSDHKPHLRNESHKISNDSVSRAVSRYFKSS